MGAAVRREALLYLVFDFRSPATVGANFGFWGHKM